MGTEREILLEEQIEELKEALVDATGVYYALLEVLAGRSNGTDICVQCVRNGYVEACALTKRQPLPWPEPI